MERVERDPIIDTVKGILILAVIIGHAYYYNPIIQPFIYSFHMAGFILFSGYFYKYDSVIVHLRKSIKGLLYPYAFFYSGTPRFFVGSGYYSPQNSVSNHRYEFLVECIYRRRECRQDLFYPDAVWRSDIICSYKQDFSGQGDFRQRGSGFGISCWRTPWKKRMVSAVEF